ncbi:MAG: glycosyltransferase [Dissulfurispiraceae bacterium]
MLFIQSGNVESALKAVEVIRTKVFADGVEIYYLADDIHPSPAESSIPDLERFISLKKGIINAFAAILKLWSTRFDAVAVMYTREGGFIKHKMMAFLIRRRQLLIFNENNDCFYYEHSKMYAHLRWRWREYVSSGKNRPLRLANDALTVIRNEGFSSFVKKSWNILTVRQQKSKPAFSLKKKIGALAFPSFDKPEVSIVIPVYNKILYTLNCLDSILKNTADVSYEVIVVDDNSTDETPQSLSLIKNIQVIWSEKNRGFIGSCNTGAAAARGRYILFLNNDTVVTQLWLSSLLNVFAKDKFCGAAGSKLVYPDGRLQEAGGIIWRDARGWNYGKFGDPEAYEFNYVREVDYCSGAALMVRRELFEQLGGFDLRFAPAYWEDTDLCFSIRKLGYKVLYQPASVVVHFEGISAGTSTASGMKKHQDLNAPKFIGKWSDELSRQCEHDPANVFLARDRNKGERILVIDHYVPTYDKDAGSFFMYSLLRAFVSFGYRVVFWPENLFRMEPYTSELQQMGIEVIYGANNFSDYMKKHGKHFDCAFITRTHIAIHFVDIVRKYISKVIYHSPDFEYLREKRRFKLEGGPEDELLKIKEREFYLFNQSDAITTVSPEDAELIHKEMPDKEIRVIHHPINKITHMVNPFEERRDLLFVGSSHPPNTDAVLFYTNDIMPLLLEKLPGVKLYVVGGNPDKKLRELDPEHIILTGFVTELLPYFEQCKIYLAPLRYGAGVKGKIIDAMSYGLPIVTTPIGAEGLGVSDGEHMLIANSKDAIVQSVLKLYSDRVLWDNVSYNSKVFIERHFSQEAFREKVKDVMDHSLANNISDRGGHCNGE